MQDIQMYIILISVSSPVRMDFLSWWVVLDWPSYDCWQC